MTDERIANNCPDCGASGDDCGCDCDYIGIRKQREMEALRKRMDKAEGELASATDLANSWARELGVQEAHNETDLKGVIERLWSKLSVRVNKAEADLTEERGRVAELVSTFGHYHIAKYDGEVLLDACAQCGLDLRDPIHKRKE